MALLGEGPLHGIVEPLQLCSTNDPTAVCMMTSVVSWLQQRCRKHRSRLSPLTEQLMGKS